MIKLCQGLRGHCRTRSTGDHGSKHHLRTEQRVPDKARVRNQNGTAKTNSLTADENANVQITQNRAHMLGYRLNCSRTTLRIVPEDRYAARNECAYVLRSGFRGQSMIACAKKHRWT